MNLLTKRDNNEKLSEIFCQFVIFLKSVYWFYQQVIYFSEILILNEPNSFLIWRFMPLLLFFPWEVILVNGRDILHPIASPLRWNHYVIKTPNKITEKKKICWMKPGLSWKMNPKFIANEYFEPQVNTHTFLELHII